MTKVIMLMLFSKQTRGHRVGDPAWASAQIFPGGGQSRHFTCLFQVVCDATQMDVHKKRPVLRQQLHRLQCFSYKILLH